MNYRHAFHAGNHADVLKHTVLLGLLAALRRKDSAFFVLDTHAGRGRYALGGSEAKRSGEASDGVGKVLAAFGRSAPPAIARYLQAIRRANPDGALRSYPGSPLLVAAELRDDDRLACCETEHEAGGALKALFADDPRIGVHSRDGYGAVEALLPPKEKRGLVLIDPPYEAQLAEFDSALAALRSGLGRWPNGIFALWYPIKLRRSLGSFFRRAASLPAKQILLAELMIRAGDSPLRLNGSGMLLLNPPWQFDHELQAALPALRDALQEDAAGSWRLDWLKQEPTSPAGARGTPHDKPPR
jgi:23S rRNA (adenine2030-N6)-methyltransferase